MPSRRHYGKHCEEDCIDTVVAHAQCFPEETKEHMLQHVSSTYRVSLATICCWYPHYILWGEYEHTTKEKIKQFNRKFKQFHHTNIITNKIVSTFKTIVDQNLEYYIDEIAEELVKHTSVYLPFSIIYKVSKEKLNYSLQICYESTKQCNKIGAEALQGSIKKFDEEFWSGISD